MAGAAGRLRAGADDRDLGFLRVGVGEPSAVHCARRIAYGVVPDVKLERSFIYSTWLINSIRLTCTIHPI
ncbi:hypothetical protein [Trebonia sp.]|uniref:hypothetical protein n=1 Tax=Trebonia sp. TaxID=2767075 RepID=UPI0026335896|nr:hypothetical protein [Trebonia sp.]